jgi:hypothetical protein
MLICKNCDTENADDAQVCQQCKMKGSQNFIYVARRQSSFNNDTSAVSISVVATCWNCSKPSGDGDKCAHCHIKLKKKEAVKLPISKKITGGKATEEAPQPPSTESLNVKRAPRKTP